MLTLFQQKQIINKLVLGANPYFELEKFKIFMILGHLV